METVYCNICINTLDICEIESHINDDYHTQQKNRLLAELIRLQELEDCPIGLSVVGYWRRHN